ncbi:MAG: hypothetical protein KDC52_03555 [Ignavibacteriae bacterium]|nr:hypothetical protein [Ignavibacteriota bacterium]MCB0750532.1 hypothetical protein [Ignavibacteriota bacterium]MCB9250768.1 hypothetical protein [Ignavibacteriales bacterium]
MKNIGGTGVYTKIIIDELLARGHTIGFWPANGVIFKEFQDKNLILYDMEQEEVNEEWDIIILQHADILYYTQRIIQQLKNVPIIFISHSSSPNDQITTDNRVMKVLKIAEGVASSNWDYPEEFIETHRNPIIIKQDSTYLKPRNPKNILLLSRLAEDKADIVRYIISTINRLPKYNLLIAGKAVFYEKYYSISNGNIKFLGQVENTDLLFKNTDLVIGSGRVALEGIANKRPVLVAGFRGLGGLVTPDNFQEYVKIMFSGRIGGQKAEKIERFDLEKKIETIFNNEKITDIVERNYLLLKQIFDHKLVVTKLEKTINNLIELFEMVNDKTRIVNLKPKLVSNCDFKNYDKQIIIERKVSGRQICVIDNELHAIISKLNGKKKIGQFLSKNIVDNSTLLQNIKELWELKLLSLTK